MSGMKDWKTYALIALAAWCAYLTWKVAQPQKLDPDSVWDAYQSAKGVPEPKPGNLLKK